MEHWILDNEIEIRITAFVGIFMLMALGELVAPRRQNSIVRNKRWPSNLGLFICDALLLRFFFPVAAVGVAAAAQSNGWGFFNTFEVAPVYSVIASLLLLDLAIYCQHVLSHHIPFLWRLHRVHHADPDFDVTTAVRFHPVEILLSMGFKCLLIVVIGPPILAVVIFEIVLNGAAMFNHANVKLPLSVDRWLRFILVTPDMHRVHHSIKPEETNTNFGFSISLWDHIFKTYRAQPQAGHQSMTIGMPLAGGYFTSVNLLRMLLLPFHRNIEVSSIGDSQAEHLK